MLIFTQSFLSDQDEIFFAVACGTEHLVSLVVHASTLGMADLGFNSCFFGGDFSRLSHTSDVKIGISLATLLGAWHCRVSAGTCWLGVSILRLDEIEHLTCNFSVVQHIQLSEQICPWDTVSCCWDVNYTLAQKLVNRLNQNVISAST